MTHADAGAHSPVGQRYFARFRFASAPANVQTPCSQDGGRWWPRLTAGVSRSGMIGRQPFALTSLTMTVDPGLDASAPPLTQARVTVTLGDGRQATHATESHRGDFNLPFAESEIRGKFRELAGTILTPAGAADVERAVDRCEEWASVGELPDLLRRSGLPRMPRRPFRIAQAASKSPRKACGGLWPIPGPLAMLPHPERIGEGLCPSVGLVDRRTRS